MRDENPDNQNNCYVHPCRCVCEVRYPSKEDDCEQPEPDYDLVFAGDHIEELEPKDRIPIGD